MRTFIFILFSFAFSSYYSFSLGGLVSFGLDFVPGVSSVKGAYEAYTGEDPITGEKLSNAERSLSFVSIIPFGNYFKNTKHLKNGQKFIKAAERAQKAGKTKNAIKFAKAGERAMTKANKIPNIFNSVIKGINGFFKGKIKNEINFAKAGGRAMTKENKAQKLFKSVVEGIKGFFK